jgi:hypothetical protein
MIFRGNLDSTSSSDDCEAKIAESRVDNRLDPPSSRFPKAQDGAVGRALGLSCLDFRNSRIITRFSEKVNIYLYYLLRWIVGTGASDAQQSFAPTPKLFSQSLVEAGNRPAGTSQGQSGAILTHQRRVAGAQAQFRLAGAMAQP